MKKIYLITIGLIIAINALAQEPCDKEIELREKVNELRQKVFDKKTKKETTTNDSYVCQLSTIPDKTFSVLCEAYHPNFEKERKKNPNITNYFMFAENDKGELNMFCENLDYKKDLANLPQDVQKRLNVIDNTIEMYKKIQEALDKEIQYNTGEIIDNGVNLAIKHIPDFLPKVKIGEMVTLNKDITNLLGNDAVQLIKNKVTDDVIKKSPPIDNWLADNMNTCFDVIDHLYIFNSATKLLTKSPLYKIIKSLPEIGKMGAHYATNLTIHVRKNEYKNYIETLEKEKQFILNTKQLYK
ncbi:MAG: hypothetical protein LBQ28_02245 [Prevotellaceae bacterium]|jgi:hypothetical protein|nr:hypothetical protein [Prevotellaceae bacterium]